MFLDVFSQVIILLLLILIGFVLTKGHILTEQGSKSMTDMVLTIVTPCVIIKSFMREYDPSLLKNLLIAFLIAFLCHLGFILLGHLFLRDRDIAKQKVLQYGVVFSNCGFMSLPLQVSIVGDMGVFYGSSYIAIFNLFVWSYGITMMSGNRKYMTPKKLIINPGIIGLTIGLIIFLFSVPTPEIINKTVSYVASLNTPLPMIIIGYHLANSNILDGIKNWKCLFAIALRLFIFPLLALAVMYICGIRGDMLISSIISCSAPVAAITTMFAAKFGRDTSLSVNLVSLSTILSLISMPLLITLTKYIA